jgi:hypothetical protein
MDHDDVPAEGRGRGLSTQDLIDVEPHGQHAADTPHDDRDEYDDANEDDTGEHGTAVAAGKRPTGEEPLAEVPSEDEVAQAQAGKPPPDAPGTDEEPSTRLFADQEVQGFRANWQEIQIAFVDDPKRAVSEADELVAAVIQSLAATFAEHKSELEAQWRQGEAPTEDLRIALRQYRSFFNQLLSS